MTLVNVRSKNHPQQVGRRGADDNADDRRTPPDLFAALHARFGFTLDAAASAENAKLPRFFAREQDALKHSWAGERVWCNPPYSDIGAWVTKAWAEIRLEAKLIAMLLPANRTEQGWWQDLVEPYRDGRIPYGPRVEFLRGRLRFTRPGWTKPAKGDRPPFGLCLLIWARDA